MDVTEQIIATKLTINPAYPYHNKVTHPSQSLKPIHQNSFEKDKIITSENRKNLLKNSNLLYWYEKSYDRMFQDIENISDLKILEIGSGTSPIKHFYPNVVTSDILPLNYLNHIFDAHEIDSCETLENLTFDIITFSNVLHHLKRPVEFLLNCENKLNKNGKIIFLEPNFGILASFIYKYIHHEDTDMSISRPEIQNIKGPLSSSNIALPYLIFFGDKNWDSEIKKHYRIRVTSHFTSLSYFITGGISYRMAIPQFLYGIIFHIDFYVTKWFPKLFSSFFIIELSKRLHKNAQSEDNINPTRSRKNRAHAANQKS